MDMFFRGDVLVMARLDEIESKTILVGGDRLEVGSVWVVCRVEEEAI